MDDLRRVWWLLRRALVVAYEDGCLGTAKAAAYSGLLSFIPVLTAVAAILVQINADRVSRMIVQALFAAVPPGTEDFVRHSFAFRGERPVSLLITATLLSLWAASGLMATLMEGFQAAYRLPTGRSAVKQRLVAVLLVLIAAGPAFGASALVVLGDRVERTALLWLGLIPAGEQLRGWVVLAGYAVRYSVSLAAIILAAAGLYYVGPNRRQLWRRVFPGALIATVLWLASTLGFAWYVRNIANYNVMYGSIGAVIAMLVWMYLMAAIALVGCEFNAELERWEISHAD